MITVKQPTTIITNEALLEKSGFTSLTFSGETTSEECIYPKDKSINLGKYNGCLIISDDYQLTTSLEFSPTPHLLSDYERILTGLYPDAEILSVACRSVVN